MNKLNKLLLNFRIDFTAKTQHTDFYSPSLFHPPQVNSWQNVLFGGREGNQSLKSFKVSETCPGTELLLSVPSSAKASESRIESTTPSDWSASVAALPVPGTKWGQFSEWLYKQCCVELTRRYCRKHDACHWHLKAETTAIHFTFQVISCLSGLKTRFWCHWSSFIKESI